MSKYTLSLYVYESWRSKQLAKELEMLTRQYQGYAWAAVRIAEVVAEKTELDARLRRYEEQPRNRG